MRYLLIVIGCLIIFGIYWFSKKRKENPHLSKPTTANEPLSEKFIQSLVNSEYAINLKSLRNHVAGHKVIDSKVGNAGFVIYLDNNSWASAYREENSIKSDYGKGEISENSLEKINSTEFGDASDGITEFSPYAQEKNDVKSEVNK